MLTEQIGSFNVAAAPVWMAGLFFLLAGRGGQPLRMLGVAAAVLFVALLVGRQSRPDRIMELYPLLFAAGAVQLAPVFARRGLGWMRFAIPALALALLVLVAPVVAPIVAPESSEAWMQALGEENEQQREVGTSRLLLPLAHRMGHDELVEAVETVVAGLPASERAGAVVLAESYAPAAALERYGGPELPPVHSGHVTYHLWGPPAGEPTVVVAVGFEPEQLAPFFDEVEVVHRTRCTFCMGWRQDAPIALARAPRQSWEEAWPALRRYGAPARKLHLMEREAEPGG